MGIESRKFGVTMLRVTQRGANGIRQTRDGWELKGDQPTQKKKIIIMILIEQKDTKSRVPSRRRTRHRKPPRGQIPSHVPRSHWLVHTGVLPTPVVHASSSCHVSMGAGDGST
ncbi:hypothetical protein GW17_00017028 [Ensete ventricosum]|uniref:Uncharacterized protein n=1 Tax=Ensete ventricosum TaxID=4639 RepID=A0A444F8S5_ENSVE|nr:hypothetical protein GW17_00017028 [Ensete ventricosum]RZR73366.1 hypothetical protein BHM03_00023247 [Ensete ventricosum]